MQTLRFGALLSFFALSLAFSPARTAAATAPRAVATPKPTAPTVVEVTLRAVAPGPSSSPQGELQARAYGARTFYSAFVFHIAGEASGFPKATSANYACVVFDDSHSAVGNGAAHANFNDVGTSYPVTDDIVAIDADQSVATAGVTWTCTITVVDKAGKPLAVDPARSILEADGAIPATPH